MSEQQVIQHCSPTLAGMKTGNLFCSAYESEETLRETIRRLNRVLVKKGLRVLPLRKRNGKALIYVYRPDFLQRDLRQGEARKMLRERGYCCEEPLLCIRRLMQRLNAGGDFPHEIGLFLGYPPEDVNGFIEDRSGCKCIGCWKVYGDEEAAKATFARYKRCTDCFCSCFARGMTLDKLAVAI